MGIVLQYASRFFDACHSCFDAAHVWFGRSLALVFVLSLILIQANDLDLLPAFLSPLLPTNLFQAVHIVFTLVLIVEIIEMVFVLPKSFTRAVGKQFEIFCLILLRHAFNELVHFSDTLTLADHVAPVLRIMADGFGALAIFLLLGVYFTFRRPLQRFRDLSFLEGFVATKKLLALVLLGFFLGVGSYNGIAVMRGTAPIHFFSISYTALVFADIFIVLVAQQYFTFFPSVFRNAGLAVSTTLMRIGLSAPPFFDVLLGVVAILFAVGIQLACCFWIRFVDRGGDARDMVRET
ncbi:hypothetical protein [Desulfoplanes sp.]